MTDQAAPEPGTRTDADAHSSDTDVGLIVAITWPCPGCGVDATVPTWVLLDMEERPELWPTARAIVECPECSTPAPRQPALMLTGVPTGIPMLVTREEASEELKVIRVCMLDRLPPDGFDGLHPHAPLIHASHNDAEPLLGPRRLPSRHARVLEEALSIRRLQDAAMAVISARSADELAAAVDTHPELLGPDVLEEWRQHLGGEEDRTERPRTTAQARMDGIPDTLLRELPQIPAAEAWQRYIERIQEAQNAFLDELEREIADLEAAGQRGEASRTMADRCMQLADWVVPEAAPYPAGLMWFTRGIMLISPLMAAPDDIEDAIDALERAIALYEAADDPVSAAQARSNLVIALHMRPRERERALERGIIVLEDLVRFFEGLPDPDQAALVRTNLAVALLDRKTGDRLDNAQRALKECHAALQHRSPERNALDYVYTITNKALADGRLADTAPTHLRAAEQAYEEALNVLPPDADAALLGRIFYNYTDLLVTTAKQQPQRREDFLTRAEACARRAVQVHEEHGHTQELAFARRQLARVLVYRAGQKPPSPQLHEPRDLYFLSLQVLNPDHYPADCIDTADEATAVCQEADDWQGASRASLTALAAWHTSGGDTVGREDLPLTPDERDPVLAELAHDSRFRFTAYTLHRAARQHLERGAPLTDLTVQTLLEQAVGIMEAGRGTTLRAASGAEVRELRMLRGIDPGLAEAYLSAVATMRSAAHSETLIAPSPEDDTRGAPNDQLPHHVPEADPGPSLEQLLAIIRSMPGFSDFARGKPPSVTELRATLKPGQALIYLIAHPAGSCALIVTPQECPTAVVPVDLPATNSARLLTLILGIGQRTDGSPDGLTPGRPRVGEALLLGPSADFHFPRFKRVLRRVLAEIGRTVGQPLACALADNAVTNAVLIPCGLLPAFAWHAATWRDQGRTMTLRDVLETLSYAPSAGSWLAARKRAERLAQQTPFLVGLANPRRSRPPLPGAEAELRHVVTCFPAQRSAVAYGAAASGRFLLGQLPTATHLHLGCHGTMRYDSVDGAFLTLADAEQLGIARIRRLAGDGLRLVVVAACVSGAVNVILQPEESHALTIGFMHAGAAGVLGALWPIPDLPTTLFITRFYEQLTEEPGIEPAAALARTQQWMRTLTPTAVRLYAGERPALAALQEHGRLRGAVPAATESRTRLAGLRARWRRHPFAAPTFWAAFVLNGC